MTAEELFCNLHDKFGEEFNWHMIRFSDIFFDQQAEREIKEGHPLFGKDMRSVAKCDSNDDVLYVTWDKGADLYIIIHLTYSSSNDIDYPKYKISGDLKTVEKYIEKDFIENYS